MEERDSLSKYELFSSLNFQLTLLSFLLFVFILQISFCSPLLSHACSSLCIAWFMFFYALGFTVLLYTVLFHIENGVASCKTTWWI